MTEIEKVTVAMLPSVPDPIGHTVLWRAQLTTIDGDRNKLGSVVVDLDAEVPGDLPGAIASAIRREIGTDRSFDEKDLQGFGDLGYPVTRVELAIW
ncbi:MAG: hypothetical protein LWW77_00405 [Propionibacteriales bacterium]|nr:hypothetical protein [Propionibacteriales bacterium]